MWRRDVARGAQLLGFCAFAAADARFSLSFSIDSIIIVNDPSPPA